MGRRSLAILFFIVIAGLALAPPFKAAAPIRLARHPDYHAGKIAFSYLGDIWIANEDGAGVQRITDNLAREIYPRFSPDGKSLAFSSNRSRQQRRLHRLDDRWRAAATHVSLWRLTMSSAGRGMRRTWSSVPTAETARFRASPRCIRSPSVADRRSRCQWTGDTGAATRLTDRRSSSTGIRRPGRASTIAGAMPRTCGSPI